MKLRHAFAVSCTEFLKYNSFVMRCAILVSFVQFKKREKHLWTSVTFSKIPR